MTARDVWRWTDERGVQRLVGTDELRAALASAILPANTLVWREGMKEWAPASSVPELASSAFAGASPDRKTDGSFDPRSTQERQRRATLVGLPTAAEVMGDSKVPVAVPSPGVRGNRPAVTQVPPFGGPTPEPPVVVVPPAPRVPAPPTSHAAPEKPKPKRRITTSEVDGLWATTTHSDEDDTIPRRARPSELAAAAAAAAEATAALRDGRNRKAGPPPAPSPGTPARKPPPPLPAAAGRLQTREGVVPKEDASAKPAPPHKPPTKSIPPPLPHRASAGAAPASSALLAPVLVPLKAVSIGEAGEAARSPSQGVSPKPPMVRIKPPSPSALREEVTVEDLTADTRAAPFKMGGNATPLVGTTLTGVAAVVLAAEKPAPEKPTATPAVAKPSRPAAPEAPKPRPPTEAAATEGPTGTRITKTLVSPRESVDSIPGLAEAIAIADDPSDTAVTAPANGVVARPQAGDDDVTAPGTWPPNGAPAATAERPGPPPAPTPGNGHNGHPSAQPADAAPMPPRVSRSSRPPPPRLPTPSHPLPPPRGEPVTAPFPTDKLTLDPATADLSDQPSFSIRESARPPAVSLGEARQAMPSTPPLEGDGESAGEPRPQRRLDEQVAVPLSSLVGAGGLLIGLVIGAFFVGRASSVPPPRLTAHPALAAVPVVARAAIPGPPKPCWMVKQPARWAPQASHRVPFDAVATRAGTLAIGYAQDAREAMGIEVDIGSGEVKSRLDDKAREEIERIVPTPAVEFRVARTGTGGPLRSPIEVAADEGGAPTAHDGGAPAGHVGGAGATPFAVGLGAGGIALASPPEGTPAPLWPLEGEEGIGAALVHPAGERGFTLVFRRGGAIWGGFIRADHKAGGELVKVAGSGGAVGKPAAGWNGREVAVIFGDRPEAEGHYEIRVGHAPPGGIPSTTTVLPLPKGGPGGDAFSPDIAGLPDGRWILMWTEGASGARAVRAQTLTPDFRPLGDPIALSPPAGNFGQGVIGVVGDRAATVFLSKGSSSYELWGAVLQCGG